MNNAILGEIMLRLPIKKGIYGYLINGCVRDIAAMKVTEFPVKARGANPKEPYKDGPGEINTTICCGGVSVNPGDIIVGDEDGVVIIPPADASMYMKKLLQCRRTSRRYLSK